MDISRPDFEIVTHKARKLLVFRYHCCSTHPLKWNPSEFLDPQKSIRMGLLYGEN